MKRTAMKRTAMNRTGRRPAASRRTAGQPTPGQSMTGRSAPGQPAGRHPAGDIDDWQDAEHTHPVLADAAWAAVTVAAVLVGSGLDGGREGTAFVSLPFAVTLGGLLFLRRRWPRTVLLLSMAVVFAGHASWLAEPGWVWPLTAAFASVVLAGRLGWAVAIGAVQLWLAFTFEAFVAARGLSGGGVRAGAEALWLAAVLAAAHAYRNWRRWRDEVVVRLRLATREEELAQARRRAEERVRIARELHDVVAHTLAVVGVHLNVAADALDSEPAEARAALKLAQQVRGRAMADLGSLIGVLREEGGDPVTAPLADLAGIADLVARVRAAGLAVTLDSSGDAEAVPAPVGSAVHRVVQEALTNTVRHAGAGRVVVTLRYASERVTLRVADDGRGPASDATEGHGIAGMRERVAALGGRFTAGPGPEGGYVVEATIPVPGLRP